MQFSDLTETIIGCAYRVHNTMGFGFLESVYESCLMIEFAKAGLEAQKQVPIEVEYAGQLVGQFVADILVDETIILELKSVKKLAFAHEVQLVNYLTATGKPIGLLINFGEAKLEIERKYRDPKRKDN